MTDAVGFGDASTQKSQPLGGSSFVPKPSKKKSEAAIKLLDQTIKNLGFQAPRFRKGKLLWGGACVAIGITAAVIGATIAVAGTVAGGVLTAHPLVGGPVVGLPIILASAVAGGGCIGAGVAATGHGIHLIRKSNLSKAIARKLYADEEFKQTKKELGITKKMTLKTLTPDLEYKFGAKKRKNIEKVIESFKKENPLVGQFLGKTITKEGEALVDKFGERQVFTTWMNLQLDEMFKEEPPPTIDEAKNRLQQWFDKTYS